MEILWNLKLFGLLSSASQVTNEEMQNAYGCFTKHIRIVSQSESSPDVFRMLNDTRVELVFIGLLYRHGQGEKCAEIRLPKKIYPIS